MSKAIKRMLSVFLCAALLFGLAPLGAVRAADPTSGTCGTNLTWSYDTTTKKLTISGTGEMNDYGGDYYNGTYVTTAPWRPYYQTMKTVVINSGVTSVGRRAFHGCTGLTAITVDSNNANYSSDTYGVLYNKTRTELIQYPIGNTRSSFTIPESVTSIGDDAFYLCAGLTSVTIGNSVTSIGDNAFYYCTGLTSVTIGNSVTSIGYHAFDYCTSLTAITVSADNPSYSSDRFGVLYNKNKTELIRYPIGNTCTSFTIPDSVTSIGDWAFDECTGLTSVTIPDSVTSIGSSAFYGCIGMTAITVDSNNANYSSDTYGVLYNKTKTELIKHPIGNTRSSFTIPDSVTRIGGYAFYNCTGLTSVTIPDSVTSIGGFAFSGCTGLTSVTIPDSVTSIGGWAFDGCTGLTSVTIPESVTSIGDYAFAFCTGLTSVTILESVTSIGNHAFAFCTGLTSVTIPESVTRIDQSTFGGCNKLADVYYAGSEAQWNSIAIDSGNEPLLNATIHYNNVSAKEFSPVSQAWLTPEEPGMGSLVTKIEIPYYCDYLTYAHATVEWSDDLFDASSTVYKKRIDMLGAALSAAAEGKKDDTFISDKISNAYLLLGVESSNISLYSYPNSSYNEKDATNLLGRKFADDDDLAFSIAYKKMSSKGKDPYNLIFITARGTTSKEEAIFDVIQGENGEVLGYKTYDYYTDFCADIISGLKHFVEKHSELQNSKTKILVCGHSLGGAAANLAAAVLTKNLGFCSLVYGKEDVFGYTYGAVSPLVNQKTNIKSGYENIFNTFNQIDTYGPRGSGHPDGIGKGEKPKGSDNEYKKFGIMRIFNYHHKAYHEVSKKGTGLSTADHDMPGYLFAIACDLVEEQNVGSYHCPVDVEFRSGGKVVGRIKNNTIDESVTTIPCAVIGDAKIFVFDKNTSYEIIQIGTDSGSMSVVYSNTGVDGETKEFNNIALEKGKTMTTVITEGEAIKDYTVQVTDSTGNAIAEINPDGSETKIKTSLWQRIVQWFRTQFARFTAFWKKLFQLNAVG